MTNRVLPAVSNSFIKTIGVTLVVRLSDGMAASGADEQEQLAGDADTAILLDPQQLASGCSVWKTGKLKLTGATTGCEQAQADFCSCAKRVWFASQPRLSRTPATQPPPNPRKMEATKK